MVPCPECGQYKLDKFEVGLSELIDGCKDRLVTVVCECGFGTMMRIKAEYMINNTVWEAISEALQDK